MESNFGDAQHLAFSLFTAVGLERPVAERCAWAISAADVLGRGSHGLLRLPHYIRRIESGGINPLAELKTIVDTGPAIVLAGDGGLGHFEVFKAAEIASDRAKTFGVAVASVNNSSHCGVLGLYTLPMVRNNLIGLAFTNGPAVMPAWGGNRPVLSTSPIACGIPTKPDPTVIDLATSTVARGKIAEAAAKGDPIPDGWAFDRAGLPTNDPNAALDGMLSPMAGAKGFALALMVEALTGVMVGPNLSTEVPDALSLKTVNSIQGVSHLVVALNPAVFDPSSGSEKRLDNLTQSIISSGGRLPGTKKPIRDPIPPDAPITVTDSVARELALYADKYDANLPPYWKS